MTLCNDHDNSALHKIQIIEIVIIQEITVELCKVKFQQKIRTF